MQKLFITSASIFIVSELLPVIEAMELDEFCLGYSRVFGTEGKQVSDDVTQALTFLDMIQSEPDFDFKFNLVSNFEYDSAYS